VFWKRQVWGRGVHATVAAMCGSSSPASCWRYRASWAWRRPSRRSPLVSSLSLSLACSLPPCFCPERRRHHHPHHVVGEIRHSSCFSLRSTARTATPEVPLPSHLATPPSITGKPRAHQAAALAMATMPRSHVASAPQLPSALSIFRCSAAISH